MGPTCSPRLKELEGEGLLRRTTPPPDGSAVYELTERGGDLEPALLGLARWGLGLLDEPRPGDAFRPEAARWARETYEFHVPVDDGVSEPEYKPAFEPDIVVRIDLHTFLSLISGWSRRTP